MPEELKSNTRKRRMPQMSSPAAKVLRTHNATESHLTNKALKNKVKNLQQQLRRSKKKIGNMADIINNLQDDLVIKSEIADRLHASFDTLQLSIFHNAKNNTTISPTGRRYTDDIKEFALTLYFYSPKAYQYVRSIIPLPNPSLIRKWSSSVDCEPGFLADAFKSLETEVKNSPTKKDCCLMIDAMAIRKQTVVDPKEKERYVGFINYGPVTPEDPDTLATEALVFLLVGTRTHWKCPVGYFLCDKMSATTQAQLIRMALVKAADAGLRVWTITADGTSVNISTFRQLGCIFGTTYKSMTTKFKHPSQDYYVYVILDPCHMLKLARNALGSLSSFNDQNGGKIKWEFFHNLHVLQQYEGLELSNRLTTQHLEFRKHKMNVRLAAQTLSSSVADAIEFLDISMKMPEFQDSQPTVIFIRTIDRLFDMLNSRNPIGKGYKQPLRPNSKDIWENSLKAAAEYLLSLRTDDGQLLTSHRRKTFITGFVTAIKSTIEMANEMFFSLDSPFKYLLTYKYSQDHLELLFSCIRSRGGWNNNPNTLQLKYALRKMLMRNAITASKNANCTDFSDGSPTNIIPIFHTRKHTSPLSEPSEDNLNDNQVNKQVTTSFTPQERMMVEHLDEGGHTEFIENILFYIGGFIVSKLLKLLTCSACRNSLVSSCPAPSQISDHDYCGVKSNSDDSASAFTHFVNRGGLQIPSKSVYLVLKYAEQVFKACVSKDGNQINREGKLRSKLILEVCHHFIVDRSDNDNLFEDHELGMNEIGFEDDHRVKLVKYVADKYFTLRLFTYGKRFCETVIQNGKPSDRFQLTKLILFKNQ